MKEFLKTFFTFAIFGIFMFFSIIMAAVITSCIVSILSLDLNEWGEIIVFIIWTCFTMPLAAAALDIISNHFYI